MALYPQLQIAISNKGKREQNEDFILPSDPASDSRVFVVCDGVGGNHQGEIASKIVAESINFYLNRKNPIPFQIKSYLTKSLRFAEERLTEYIEEHPSSLGMASTVACLEFGRKKAMGFWVGDSKIYQIRDKKIIFESIDHTLYQELKNQPETNREKLDEFPYKHYILRAVKGTHKPAQPEHFVLSDIKVNDYFVLLTDGIKEAFKKKELLEILHELDGSEILKNNIEKVCELKSKDNYSILIVKILEA
ncbi:MAG: PP2C family serine/threonine-protein phosphatase [Crocinitomicaceae bacterium]|nr:serine/threonine-protein phosphatase [Crocinitomicaceae bacterium]